MSGNCIAEPVTLADWQKVLEELGFEHKYYQYLDSELICVDWFKEKEHIITFCYYTEEYCDYLKSLPEGTEYTPDWTQCPVTEILIETKEFGYPEGSHDLDGRWEGNIRLSDKHIYENFSSLSLEYFYKALWMSRNPISAKNEIVVGYAKEVDLFLQKYKEILAELGFEEEGNTLLLVGYEVCETEPYLEYSHRNSYNLGGLIISYNMFTKKLYWTKYVENLEDDRRLHPYFEYQVNVNDIPAEEFKAELINYLKHLNLI